jgi:serine protease Do
MIGVKYSAITSFNNSQTILNALADKGYEDAQGTMVISTVNDDSDLKNKDIQEYDMIVAIDGKTLTSTDVMTSALSNASPGDTVKLTIARIENNNIEIFDVDCELIESKG